MGSYRIQTCTVLHLKGYARHQSASPCPNPRVWVSLWVQGGRQPKSSSRSRHSRCARRVWRRHALRLLPLWNARRRRKRGYVVWCVTSSSLELPARVRERQLVPVGVVKACASSQRCSSLPALRYVILRYINSVKGNSFQRRVCLRNFSRDCEGNTACMILLCMCACLSGSCSLQCT